MLTQKEKQAARTGTRFDGDVVWGTANEKTPDMALAEFRGVKFEPQGKYMVPCIGEGEAAHQATVDLAESFGFAGGSCSYCKNFLDLSGYMQYMHALRHEGETIFERWKSVD